MLQQCWSVVCNIRPTSCRYWIHTPYWLGLRTSPSCRTVPRPNIPYRPKLDDYKMNKWGFRPLLCTYRLHWAKRTSWGWWDERDDTALPTQDSKFEPRRTEAEHATSQSRRLPMHDTESFWVSGEETFECQSGGQTREPRFNMQAALITTPLPPTWQ